MSCKIHAESYNEIIERNWPEGIKKTRQRVDIFEKRLGFEKKRLDV